MSQKLVSKFPSLYILFNHNNKDLKNIFINIKGYKAIKKDNLFDADYYLKNNNDVQLSGMDALIHYLYYGFKEGRKPNSQFDAKYYLKKYNDVQKSGLNPLIHYSLYGKKEKRKVNESQKTSNQIELEEKTKFSTIPDYKNLKLALKGKDGYLFLINDSNNEIRQHFDQAYTNKFNDNLFIKSFESKKKFCYNNGIIFFFFIVPDKSLVCKDLLPFDVKLVKRNYDLINSLVPDFTKNLDHKCCFKNDSHTNYLGGKELAYCYLNYIDNNFTRDDFNKLVNEQITAFNPEYNGDLRSEKNFSYSDEEKMDYLNEKITIFKNEGLLSLNGNLPEEFRSVRTRETDYYKNPQGFTDLRVLIFRDSSTIYLKDVLSVYFKEILLYWDHWFFNKELIEWYRPDIILEIRTERFLENMNYDIL